MAKVPLKFVTATWVVVSWLLIGGLLPRAWAQSDMLAFESPTGEWLALGQSYFTTNSAEISVSGNATLIEVKAVGIEFMFTAPQGSTFAIGSYPNAVTAQMNTTTAGLSVYTSRGCKEYSGSIRILELEVVDGVIERLWLMSTQRCDGSAIPSYSEIRYRSLKAGPAHPYRLLRVPQDFPSLQEAVDIALDGHTVEVGPGTYQGGVEIRSKSIRLVSKDGPASTIIMGLPSKPAITFSENNSTDGSLEGFTIRGGSRGCFVNRASPRIAGNRFQLNQIPVHLSQTSAVVVSNLISDSVVSSDIERFGDGIYIDGAGRPVVEHNRIERTVSGVYATSPSVPILRNNRFESNGYGIILSDVSIGDVAQNVFFGILYSGIDLTVKTGPGPVIRFNTIYGSEAVGINASGSLSELVISRNVVSGMRGISFQTSSVAVPPGVVNNDVYSPIGTSFIGSLPNLNGIGGNFVDNPRFVFGPGGDLRLLPTSPAVDRVKASLELLTDIDGNKRATDSVTGQIGFTDVGAYEYIPGPPRPSQSILVKSKSDSVQLVWSKFDLAYMYEVRRSSSLEGPFEVIANVEEEHFEDFEAISGQLYYYAIAGINDWGVGGSTDPVGGRIDNRAPVVVNDVIEGDEDTIFEARILDNDTDPDGDPLTYRIVTRPSQCTIHALPRSILIRPRSDWNGSDVIVYEVVDALGAVARGMATLRVGAVNDPPMLGWAEFGVDVDTRIQLSLPVADPDGDAPSIRIITPATNGIVTVVRGKAAVFYQPAHGFIGTDRFQLETFDKFSTGNSQWYLVHVLPPPDLDGDGMDDVWEKLNGVSDPLADPDQDGSSNYAEFLALTKPTDTNSILKIDGIVQSPGGIQLNWTSVGSVRYRVFSSENGLDWTALTSTPDEEIDSTTPKRASKKSYIDSRPQPTIGARFYMLQVVGP